MAQHPLHHGIIWKLVDLNRQGLEWCDVVANARVHGTTHRVPWEMLAEERPHLGKLPDRATLAPYLREDRKVSQGRFRQLGGLPVRRPLEVGRGQGAGGGAPGHGGDLGW